MKAMKETHYLRAIEQEGVMVPCITCEAEPTAACHTSCVHQDAAVSTGTDHLGICADSTTCSARYLVGHCVWVDVLETNAEEGIGYAYLGDLGEHDLQVRGEPLPVRLVWHKDCGYGWYYAHENPTGPQGFPGMATPVAASVARVQWDSTTEERAWEQAHLELRERYAILLDELSQLRDRAELLGHVPLVDLVAVLDPHIG